MKNDTFLIEMGLRIASRRKELRLTQEQIADKMDVSLQTVSCIELGKKAIRPDNLVKLCECLDVTADYVLLGKRDEDQMSELLVKLSSLDAEEYELVSSLILHFSKKRKKRTEEAEKIF